MVDWQSIANDIANDHSIAFEPTTVTPVAGGDIASSYRCQSAETNYFVKLHSQQEMKLLAAEADGATALADAGAVRVPAVLGMGVSAPWAYLILEWIEFGRPSDSAQERLGIGLAKLHRALGPEYGWHAANFIGANPQINQPHPDWVEFYCRRRLMPQLALAESRGFDIVVSRGKRLIERLTPLLSHAPPASLLHGDLWGGNWGVDEHDRPVIFDPAVYFGDRETDLAMTRLFGGFSARFYAAYETTWPLPAGWQDRLPVYQLYHVLNHLNLFGGGYLGQALGLLDELERLV